MFTGTLGIIQYQKTLWSSDFRGFSSILMWKKTDSRVAFSWLLHADARCFVIFTNSLAPGLVWELTEGIDRVGYGCGKILLMVSLFQWGQLRCYSGTDAWEHTFFFSSSNILYSGSPELFNWTSTFRPPCLSLHCPILVKSSAKSV